MKAIFKKAKDSDFNELYKLQAISFQGSIDILSSKGISISLPNPELLKQRYPDMDFFKLIDDHGIIGGAYTKKLDAVTCEIYRIFVSPQKQMQGFGSMILSNIIEAYPECTDFVLDTPTLLDNNLRFYKKNCFTCRQVKQVSNYELQHLVRTVNRNAVTGLKPSDGGLHLGHFVGNISPLIRFQDIYNCSFMFADWQVLNSNIAYYDKKHLDSNMSLILKQIFALGVKPNKLKILMESKDKALMLEEFVWLSDFITDSRVYRLPAIGHTKDQERTVKMSLMSYPLLQALDCIITKADVVFSNIDNKACIELINELFKKVEKKGLKDYKPIKLITGKVDMLIGIDGQKMSKAKGNCISFLDTEDEIRKKINKMYTDSSRISADTPGQVDNNIVFKYLKVFASETDYDNLSREYLNGTISDARTKEILLDLILTIFDEYRKSFEEISDSDVEQFLGEYK